MLSNPIILCGIIAFAIVCVLILVVVICIKRSDSREREELMEISQEIDDSIENVENDKLEDVLNKMQEALDLKEETSVSFEQSQEESAIISYQELLKSLGGNGSIDIDNIEVYDDELDNQIEISDFNKEIIDAYQNEDLEKEIFNFQNDYSCEGLPASIPNEESPVMKIDFSSQEELSVDNIEYVDEVNFNDDNLVAETISYDVDNEVLNDYEFKHAYNPDKKFKRTEFISPVYGIIDSDNIVEIKDNNVSFNEDVEEILFEDDSF